MAISERGETTPEVSELRREREVLLQRIRNLESNLVRPTTSGHRHEAGHHIRHSSSSNEDASKGKSTDDIVHSVQIRTSGKSAETNGNNNNSNQVSIEIKQRQQQQQLQQHHQHRLFTSPRAAVVNLRASADNLAMANHHHHHNNRSSMSSSSRRNSFSSNNKLLYPASSRSSVSGRISQLHSTRSSKSKSQSVENLSVNTVLGLKSANSEMNVASARPLLSRGTNDGDLANKRSKRRAASELNVSRIGSGDKIHVSEILLSMPAELRPSPSEISLRPNRDKVRSVLNTSSVIELQRQLLTTVMENEVRMRPIQYCV